MSSEDYQMLRINEKENDNNRHDAARECESVIQSSESVLVAACELEMEVKGDDQCGQPADSTAISVESAPKDSLAAPRRFTKKRVFLIVFGVSVLVVFSLLLAILIDVLIAKPSLSLSGSVVRLSEHASMSGNAKFSGPRLSSVELPYATCSLYRPFNQSSLPSSDFSSLDAGEYFGSASVDSTTLSSSFPVYAHFSSIDIRVLTSVITDFLKANRDGGAYSINAVCEADATLRDSVFGFSYTKHVSFSKSLPLRSDSNSDDANGKFPFDGLGDNFRLEVDGFEYFFNLKSSGHSTFGCYAMKSETFAYDITGDSLLKQVGVDIYEQWMKATLWSRVDCNSVCRRNFDGASEGEGLQICSPSNTLVTNFLGDHNLQVEFNSPQDEEMLGTKAPSLAFRVIDSIHQYSSLSSAPVHQSQYTAAHFSHFFSSGTADVLPPELIQAVGWDASLHIDYNFDTLSSKYTNVDAHAALSIEDPSSFSLISSADLSLLFDFRSSSLSAVNGSAAFASLYAPTSSFPSHYGGALNLDFSLDQVAQSLSLAAAFGFDANGRRFGAPTEYDLQLYGQYSHVQSTVEYIQVDGNGQVGWDLSERSLFNGQVYIDMTNQKASVRFNELPPGASAVRTSYAASASYQYSSSPLIQLSLSNGVGSLTFSSSPQSVHSFSLNLVAPRAVRNTDWPLQLDVTVSERAPTDPTTVQRVAIDEHLALQVQLSSASTITFNSQGTITINYWFITKYIAQFIVNTQQQTVQLSFYEGGALDYPSQPGVPARTAYAFTEPLVYSFSSSSSPLNIVLRVGAAGQLTFNRIVQSIHSLSLVFNLYTNSQALYQVIFTTSLVDYSGSDPQSTCRTCISHTTTATLASSSSVFSKSVSTVKSQGSVTINYRFVSAFLLQASVDGTQQLATISFAEGGLYDYPNVPSGTPRTAYTLNPSKYSFSSGSGFVSLILTASGSLTYNYALNSIHSLQSTFLFNSGSSITTSLDFTLNDRSGTDAPTVSRVLLDEHFSFSNANPQVTITSSGTIVINYGFITSYTAQFGLNTQQKTAEFAFYEGGAFDYPSHPGVPARTAYVLTQPFVYSFSSASNPIAVVLTFGLSAQLTFNRIVQSVHSLSFSLNFFKDFVSMIHGTLATTFSENSGSDPVSTCRVCISETATIALPTTSDAFYSNIVSFSADGRITINYNFLTAFQGEATINGKQGLIALSFAEGGLNDYPNVPGGLPRSAYSFTPAVQYTFSSAQSPLSVALSVTGSGQLTFSRSVQSIHSVSIQLQLYQDSQSLVQFALTTTVAERAGLDSADACRLCVQQTTTAQIPVSSSAFTSNLATLSATGTVQVKYAFLTGFAVSAVVDGGQQIVQITFAEGGLNDFPQQPSASARTGFNVKGSYAYSTSPLIISSNGNGTLTYNRALQSAFSYSFLFNQDTSSIDISVSETSPSDVSQPGLPRSALHFVHMPFTVDTPLQASLQAVRSYKEVLNAEMQVRMECDQESQTISTVWSSTIEHAGCGAKDEALLVRLGSWQDVKNAAPLLLCHVEGASTLPYNGGMGAPIEPVYLYSNDLYQP